MILLLLSFIRTIVPAIVGMVIGFFTTIGLDVDPEFEGALTAVLGTVFMALYYLIVRIIEMKFPIVGVLIGWAKSPDSYSKGPGVEIEKPSGDVHVTVNNAYTESEPTVIPGTTLPNLNSSVVSNLDRAPGPDHRAE
jgi:hypothetical protein